MYSPPGGYPRQDSPGTPSRNSISPQVFFTPSPVRITPQKDTTSPSEDALAEVFTILVSPLSIFTDCFGSLIFSFV